MNAKRTRLYKPRWISIPTQPDHPPVRIGFIQRRESPYDGWIAALPSGKALNVFATGREALLAIEDYYKKHQVKG